MTQEELRAQLAASDAMIRARDRARQTPSIVRRAMLWGGEVRSAVRLMPVTMGALWLLEELEHPLVWQSPDRGDLVGCLLDAAYILAAPELARDALAQGKGFFSREVFRNARSLEADSLGVIQGSVEAAMEGAFATVPGKGATTAGNGSLGPEKDAGIGWTLGVVESMLASYQWPAYVDHAGRARTPLDFVVWRLPLAQVFCLVAAGMARDQVEPRGPTYVQQEMIAARPAAEELSTLH